MSNELETLPRLIEQAMAALDNATTAAEVLDARDQAKIAYDAAKSAARFAKAKSAHATILATCHRMQADALTIEARAQSRLADEYDAAQERGEINKAGKPVIIPRRNNKASVADARLRPKEIHEARQVRDAERRDPDIVRKTVDAKLAACEEPTRADVKRAVRTKSARPKSMIGSGIADACGETLPSKTPEEQHHYDFLYKASQGIFYGKDALKDVKAADDAWEITPQLLGAARETIKVWSDLMIELERRFNNQYGQK